MALVDSRLGPGTLVLGTLTGAECQMANVRLTTSADEEEGTATLCEPDPTPTVKTSWALAGDAIQDWETAAGFVSFCMDEDGSTVTFDWTPSTSKTTSYSGSCQVRAVEIGGPAGEQLTTSFEFPVIGTPIRTDV